MKNTIGKGVFAKGGEVLSKENALISAMQMGVDFDKDFHAQSYGNELAELAKKVRYRKSKTSSGSLGRAFFDHLKKIYDKNPSKYQDLVKSFSEGGSIGFKGLSDKVAKRYAGKKVAPKYQGEYGKRYSKSEAKEVGDKVAGKVYWQQQGRKMAMGGGLAQYPNDLPKAEAERLFHLSHKNAKVGDRLWNNFKRTPLRLIYSNLDDRGIKYARGGNVNKGGEILQEISTHKAVKKGDKIYIYLKGLTIKNDDDREFAKEFPDLFKDELLRVIPAENEDDLFDIFENYEETNRYNLSGYARGGNVNTGRAWRLDRAKYNKSERYETPYSERKSKFEDGGQIGQEIVFDDSGEENTGVIKDITNAGDYIVKADDGRTLLAQRQLDVISLGAMRSASNEAPRKRFGFFEDGGQIGQEIVFDDSGEENTGVIKDVTNAGDYIVSSDDGRTLLAQRDRDVISLGKMREMPMAKKRFGFFEEGGGVGNTKTTPSHIVKFKQDFAEGGLNTRIRTWYMKTFPQDERGQYIDLYNTFADLWNALQNKENVYNVIGEGDSLIRERLFDKLSQLKGVKYMDVYNLWLESDDDDYFAQGGGVSGLDDLIRG